MPAQPFARRHWWWYAAGAAALIVTAANGWAQSIHAVRYRGTIDAVEARSFSLTTRSGQPLTMALAFDTAILAVVPISLEDIKAGSYIGAAAMPRADGTQLAIEVHVFPEAMRGTDEGRQPFDLQPESTMTNGTVATVTGTVGRTLVVRYQDGEKTIVVPPDTPIVTFEPGTRALLLPGANVIVSGSEGAQGKLSATRILVGKDGLVPPM